MRTSILLLALVFLPAVACGQSVVTKEAQPGTRNTNVVYYDGEFLFMTVSAHHCHVA